MKASVARFRTVNRVTLRVIGASVAGGSVAGLSFACRAATSEWDMPEFLSRVFTRKLRLPAKRVDGRESGPIGLLNRR